MRVVLEGFGKDSGGHGHGEKNTGQQADRDIAMERQFTGIQGCLLSSSHHIGDIMDVHARTFKNQIRKRVHIAHVITIIKNVLQKGRYFLYLTLSYASAERQ